MTTIRTATMRVLALLALAAVAIAVLLIVSASDSGDQGNRRQPAQEQQQGQGKKNRGDNEGQQARRFYVVQSGDTLSSIAEETGTTVEELQELNPDIDPQILVSGQKLKLR